MKHLFLISCILSFVYTQCDQTNWQQYSPNLEYCDLEDVNIAWTDLSGFNLSGANLTGANLTGSVFSYANLNNATLMDADLTWTTFFQATLINANLSGAGLGAADFTSANLSGANLYGATFFDTNFSNTCIENTYGFPTSGYTGEPILGSCATSAPDWFVNPANFEHVMSITARVFSGLYDIGTESDLLGAFYNGECVGVAEAAEVPPFLGGGHAFLIQAFSNMLSAHMISFQFYSVAENIIYDINEVLSFTPDGILGDLMDPIMLQTIDPSDENASPVAESATYALSEDTTISFDLSASDIDGDILSYLIDSEPSHGSLMLSGITATYVPNINYFGEDSFVFYVNDGQTSSNLATINLFVSGVNDAPYLYAIDNASIGYGEVFSYTLQAEDADGDDLIYTATASGGNAIINIDENILTVMPEESNVTLEITITVSDGNTTHSTSFLLTVLQQETTCVDSNNDGWCDHFPTLTLNGETVLLLNVAPGAEYTDMGAGCSDTEEGDISALVEVSGDIVNLAVPDVYQIYFNCSDGDTNAAQTLIRTVVVVDIALFDDNGDGFDDISFMAGAQSGDANLDGSLNIVDIVMLVSTILNRE
jgi:hypothetical protein